jgi:hypothetical protein
MGGAGIRNLKSSYILICDGHGNFVAVCSFTVMPQGDESILPGRNALEAECAADWIVRRAEPGRHGLAMSAHSKQGQCRGLRRCQQFSGYGECGVTTKLYLDELTLPLTKTDGLGIGQSAV